MNVCLSFPLKSQFVPYMLLVVPFSEWVSSRIPHAPLRTELDDKHQRAGC
jgi:hypothetical protein